MTREQITVFTLSDIFRSAKAALALRRDMDASAPSSARLRILVIEDDSELADLFVTALQDHGHEVQVVGSRALPEAPRSGGFDIAFVDVDQRDGHWRSTVDALVMSDPEMPIVLVCNWTESLAREEVEAPSVKAILPKPFGASELQRVVAAVCSPI